jgi:hypothetical protein
MIRIPLNPVPSQNFTSILDNVFFNITIKYIAGAMGISIQAAGEKLITNQILVPGTPILNYPYLEQGNFILLTANEEIADFNKFGVSQVLIYASQAEVEAIRAE